MNADQRQAVAVSRYAEHVNPYLAKLMNFAGFGVEDRAEGCYLYDSDGKQYLDCLGGYGVFSLGHRHPKVVEAVKKQLDKMPLSSKVFFGERQAELAERLAGVAPGNLKYTFFNNSGAEAVEAALKFAKAATGRSKVVSTEGGYHGKTIGALSTTGRSKYRERFEPLMPGVEFIPFGKVEALQQAIDETTACFIVEAIQGEGGIIVPPDGYLTEARKRCSEVGALLVLDEVQTGLGRTGRWFGCDHDGVAPDIMTLAKALGGGVMPIGATMFTEPVLNAVYGSNPLLHTSTFGGNPMSCAAGLATLEVIESEGLVERSKTLGKHLVDSLKEVQARQSELISDVRGKGLMVGVEFAMDEVGELVVAQMTKRGLVAAYTLNNPRVIRLEPPLTIEREQVDWAVRAFHESVAETSELLSQLL